jgi:tripartite-type tricarboxylate transporter receptor subunit TctC
MRFFTVVCLLGIFQGSGLIGSETACAATLSEHFEGKTIKIIHGSSPGGGYDLSARALARFLPDYLPGKPARIIVQPRPGGGKYRSKSLRAIIRATPNGSTVGYVYPSWIMAEAIGEGAPAFSLEDVKFLGTAFGGFRDQVFCARADVATSWEDIEKLGRLIKWGSMAPQGSQSAAWLKELGAPINTVYGYGGTTEVSAAIRRGELELSSSCASTLYRDYPDWVTPDNVSPVFWVGRGDKLDPKLEAVLKKTGLKTPPHIFEVARKYITAAWQKEAFEVGLNLERLRYALVVPAGVPEEVYAAWRKVFRQIIEDPRYVKSLSPRDRGRLQPMYAEKIQQTLKAAQNLSPEALRMTIKLSGG